ncbi:peptidase M50 [Mycobacterium sp. DL592]|uniref:peptidase M50 n=1 Tax=Mycobacterium sp. DL592 TaxID=2675524 RepID=UPI00141EB530|nr:peptidase M50 [Mycobacterium sp. DL592]
MTKTDIAVLRFGGRRIPRPLATLPCHDADGAAAIDAAVEGLRRVVVVGTEADLAAVLTRLLRTERLDLEVAHVGGWRGVRAALTAAAQRVPLIRDESGTVVVGAALWLPPGEEAMLHGEAVVDDDVLFDGSVPGVRIEPITSMPGLRAAVVSGRMRPQRWLTGRAVQFGGTGARVVRDGANGPREVKRAAFYRHVTGWLRVH